MSAAVGDRRRGYRAVLRTLDMTYGDQDPRDYPVLEADGLQEQAIARIMNVVPNWVVAGVPEKEPELWRLLKRFGGSTEQNAPIPDRTSRANVRLPNLDPSAGGLPAKVTSAEAHA